MKGIGLETVVEDWFVVGRRVFCCSAVSCVEGESSVMFAISVSAIVEIWDVKLNALSSLSASKLFLSAREGAELSAHSHVTVRPELL